MQKKFQFWVNYLKTVSLFMAAMGVMWAIVGSFDPFGLYDTQFAKAFWNVEQLPTDAKRTFQFLAIPLGATNMGFFILQYFIATNAYARKEKWAYKAIMYGFFGWFLLDTGMCLWYKAYFNILMANIPALLAMLPIVFTRKYFNGEKS